MPEVVFSHRKSPSVSGGAAAAVAMVDTNPTEERVWSSWEIERRLYFMIHRGQEELEEWVWEHSVAHKRGKDEPLG